GAADRREPAMTDAYIRTILEKVRTKQLAKPVAYELIQAYSAARGAGVARDQRIAVIGMACRFPDAPDYAAYWRNLRDGVDSVRAFPATRRGDIDPLLPLYEGKLVAGADPYFEGGFLDEIDKFDHERFGILSGE